MSSELRAKLARLRREERPAPMASDTEPLPSWLVSRLASPRGAPATPREPELPGGLVEEQNERGVFAVRHGTFSGDHRHGSVALAEALDGSPAELAWLARAPELASIDPARCVWLDIETTGLAGGVGTIPFLVALGSFEGGCFRLWQAFLRDPGEEAAALQAVAERVRAADGVVSFFGKSFDRHRLEDKMRVHRIEPPFRGKPHLDLYHPLARLYRGAYLDGRLATFERELCSVERADDLPGSLAPAAWFDYLAGRAHRLEAVFRHNELDVLSLVVLAAHVARARRELAPDGTALPGAPRARARALAVLSVAHGEHAAALHWFDVALAREGSGGRELRFLRATCLRRLGERPAALAEFHGLACEQADALAARAWAEVLRLARRARHAELVAEAGTRGPAVIHAHLTGRARARLLEVFERAARASR